MFSSNASRLKFRPENGMSVIIRGRVSIYERDGKYQLYIDDMQPDGIGTLSLAFEQLKEKLSNEGLFDNKHKLPIPKYPQKIGVISSPTGAAVQDVLNVLNRRYPIAEIIFAGVQVQGESASQSICKAIQQMNNTDADVIIIARGGGSVEDLWPFNDEKLAYEIFNSPIPVISGVGHETDFTICDFVSDLRAPTPSAAAELAVPDITELRTQLTSLERRIEYSITNRVYNYREKLSRISDIPFFKSPEAYIDKKKNDLLNSEIKFFNAADRICEPKRNDLSKICARLSAMNPLAVLARGYSAIYTDEGNIASSISVLKIGDEITISMSDGDAEAKILNTKQIKR
jgi:exodeoxyribonuclease VII large subunit